ncbi:hypothetical protein AMS68_000564 [Peltaster fructicola]|uniref:N-acetyltransferase domain-containing protein n=1 Tax=Peltaster fructicola TaxID=286661 RepID=A0A6H0XJY6_9PEZI|nr:hypothetical protein AMS68_000564 [Peltaster fructicola]
MPIHIERLTPADVPTKCKIELEAFKNHPRIPMMWPRGYTADLYSFKESSDASSLANPQCRMFKAVDAIRGIVGTAEWTLALDVDAQAHQQPTPDDAPPPANWPEGGNWALRRFYKINIEKLLRQHLDNQPYIMLNFLTVAPAMQGQGVGSRLMQWGVEEADRRGAAIVLESTPTGLALYKRHGFVTIEVINADMRAFGRTEPYDEAAAIRVFMIRYAR